MSETFGDDADGLLDEGVLDEDVDEGESLVRVRDLHTYYDDGGFLGDPPVRAVDGVSFDVRRGETFGVVGESGCGKSTLGRTLIGLETPREGAVRVGGQDVTALSGSSKREWQRNAQMVFQDPEESLNDRMTVGEIVREPLDAHDWGTTQERRARSLEFLDLVGLQEEHYYRYPHQFSGGQRQRIGIARALILEPEFVVLDEPVSALDVSVQARIINLLDDLQDELDLTYLFIAHDLSVVRHICDRVAVMYLGSVVERGPTEELFTDPRHPYTEALLSAIPGDRTAGDAGSREQIRLRGTPPSPRYPPAGCPLATRCPAKVRPDEFEDLDEDAWQAIGDLREVIRVRIREDTSPVAALTRRLGIAADDEIDEIATELFADLSLPDAAREAVDAAVDRARTGADEEAEEILAEAFGSVCDREHPEGREFDDGRISRCVRHDPDYRDVGEVLDARFD